MRDDTSFATPSYIPPGYELRRQINGEMAEGFGRDADQIALIYTRSWANEDWVFPLTVYVAGHPGRILVATEQHAGDVVKLSVPKVNAVYHDGMWAPGPGDDEQHVAAAVFHWNRNEVHSITVVSQVKTYAVRGPRQRGVAFGELIKIAESFWRHAS
jgi:hypothetical protein